MVIMQPLWRLLLVVFVVAVATNYVWELAQSPLFEAAAHDGNVWIHCFVASLGDGIMVLSLYAFVALIRKDRGWFGHPTRRNYALLLGAGALLAVLVEWYAVHVLGRWSYLETMPRIPGFEIGVVPILQMVLLPPLIFYLAALLLSLRSEGTTAGR